MPAAGGGGGGDPRGQHFRPAHLTVVLRAIGVILATFALTSLCSALRDRHNAAATQSHVVGLLDRVTIKNEPGQKNSPAYRWISIHYRYRVQGEPYEVGRGFRNDTPEGSLNYRQGSNVTVYYNPDYPAMSALLRPDPNSPGLLGPLLLAGFGIALQIFAPRLAGELWKRRGSFQ